MLRCANNLDMPFEKIDLHGLIALTIERTAYVDFVAIARRVCNHLINGDTWKGRRVYWSLLCKDVRSICSRHAHWSLLIQCNPFFCLIVVFAVKVPFREAPHCAIPEASRLFPVGRFYLA